VYLAREEPVATESQQQQQQEQQQEEIHVRGGNFCNDFYFKKMTLTH